MANEPEDTVFVDADTDDLDAFSDLLSGKAKETPKVEEVKEDPVEDEDLAPVDDEGNDDEPEADGEEDLPQEDPKPKPKNRFQDRINDLTAKAREAERRESVLQARLAALESKQPSAVEPAATPVTPVQSDEPSPEAKNQDGSDKYPLGEFDPQYIRDLTRHTIQKEQALANQAREAQDAERTANEAKTQLQHQWETNLAPATEKYEDFFDKTVQLEDTFKNLDPGYSEYLASTIKALDNGPDVLYYLANHLDEAQAFVNAGPVMATIALGKFSAMFDKASKADTKAAVVSKAPPPPQVNKGSKARVNTPDDTDDLDAFAEKFFKKK